MKDQTNEFEAKYPAKDFNKSVYSFDSQELRKLTSLDTIAQMGQMAQMMINNIVQGECLARVGAKNSPDIGVLYDIPKAQFVVFSPKLWCIACKARRAQFEYKGHFYCQSCLDIQKVADQGKGKIKEEKKKAK